MAEAGIVAARWRNSSASRSGSFAGAGRARLSSARRLRVRTFHGALRTDAPYLTRCLRPDALSCLRRRVPEARKKLAGGGAQRNHRLIRNYPVRATGARPSGRRDVRPARGGRIYPTAFLRLTRQ